jgi:hypothetical protein
MIVDRRHGTHFVEAFNEHPRLIHIRESERTMNSSATFFECPVFHCAK